MSCKKSEKISGPALISADNTTIVVEPDWQAEVDKEFNVILTQEKTSKKTINSEHASPILLEVFNNAFMNCAVLMGSVLAKTAVSVNIKERQDYSCALFDKEGNLIANAPHMPVHLGSMSEAVKQIIADRSCPVAGQSYLLNNPYRGGTHLPDVTVISPYFYQNELQFYVASRGHHADIGGISPGSLPAHSHKIQDEGIVINDFLLVDNGELRYEELWELLTKGGARNPAQNIADLKAQLAANQKGINELQRLIEQYSLEIIQNYVKHVQNNAKQTVENALARLNSGTYNYVMDDGKNIKINIQIKGSKARFDFTGTAKQQDDNFNAPQAVVKASILYVLRTLVTHEIPLNEGCLLPIEIISPEASLVNPQYPHAVVAGNVETSQAIANTIYCALGIMAAAQGTMNNLTFGNDQYQYYETLCGGTGAGRNFDGCDAIHSHMTNSLLTDPEVFELRLPILLREFSIRENSGGKGKHRGGNGIKRIIEFLQPMTVNMISNHRKTAPPGLSGGGNGSSGINQIQRKNGKVELYPSCFEADVSQGDCIIIQTPGGGAYG